MFGHGQWCGHATNTRTAHEFTMLQRFGCHGRKVTIGSGLFVTARDVLVFLLLRFGGLAVGSLYLVRVAVCPVREPDTG